MGILDWFRSGGARQIPENHLFERYNPNDMIYLTTIHFKNEQIAEGGTTMLYVDSHGILKAAYIDKGLLELSQRVVERERSMGRFAAAVTLEVSPGKSVTFAVQISAEQARGLKLIIEAAPKVGIDPGELPDSLKKYPAEIIKLAHARRKELRL